MCFHLAAGAEGLGSSGVKQDFTELGRTGAPKIFSTFPDLSAESPATRIGRPWRLVVLLGLDPHMLTLPGVPSDNAMPRPDRFVPEGHSCNETCSA